MSRFVWFFSAHAGARIPPPPCCCCCCLPAACSDQIADPVTVIITSVCICAPIFSGSAALGPASIPYARLRCSCTQCHHTAPALSVVDTIGKDARCVCARVCVTPATPNCRRASICMPCMWCVLVTQARVGGGRNHCWQSQRRLTITMTIARFSECQMLAASKARIPYPYHPSKPCRNKASRVLESQRRDVMISKAIFHPR